MSRSPRARRSRGGSVGPVAASLRRRRSARASRVLLHDAHGRARTLPPDDPQARALLAAARALLDALPGDAGR